jgi:peptide/nickel transport system substrate-binding protein
MVLALVASGCSGGKATKTDTTPKTDTTTQAAPANKNLTVNIAMWSPPNNFHPLNTDSSYGFFAISIMFDNLVSMNDKGDFVPRLAEKWDISPDFTTFTFHLNPKAKWHDGQPVTAKDVAFTMNTISNKETVNNRSANISMLKGADENGKSANGTLEGVKVVDDKTIQFITKAPVDPLSVLEKVGSYIRIIPEHVLGQVAPKDLEKHAFFMNPTVGSGPFKFVKYVTDQYIEYTRNDDYYLGKPILEKVFLKIMPATTAVAALEKGEIDVTAGQGIGEVPIQDWEKVQALPNINAVTFASKGYQYMDINHTKAYLQNQKVRQALVYGINRKMIVDNLLKGNGQIVEGPYTSVYKYLDKTIQPRAFDANKAKQLLTEAGWDFNRKLSLVVPLGNKVREQSADIIMANFQQVGLKVEIQKVDFPTLQARRKAGDYDVALIGWSDILDPDVSSQFRTGGIYNSGLYSNKQVDDLLAKGIVTAEFNARKAIYDQFQKLIYDDVPAVFLYSPNGLTAVSKRMVNVNMSTFDITYNLEKWDVTK